MLRSVKGIWRRHRKAEGGLPPSDSLPLHDVVTVLNILSVQVIEPVKYGRFCFAAQAVQVETTKRSKLGSHWQFFISDWQCD